MFDANRDGLARHSDCAGLSSGLIGSSPRFMAVFEDVRTAAPVECAVLLRGETGTGKELVARAIHTQSEQRAAPFVKLNSAAIPAELLESELFGHEKRAFTRAVNQMLGRFEAANRGTLFWMKSVPSICRPNYCGSWFFPLLHYRLHASTRPPSIANGGRVRL